jgi:hypothetical protein
MAGSTAHTDSGCNSDSVTQLCHTAHWHEHTVAQPMALQQTSIKQQQCPEAIPPPPPVTRSLTGGNLVLRRFRGGTTCPGPGFLPCCTATPSHLATTVFVKPLWLHSLFTSQPAASQLPIHHSLLCCPPHCCSPPAKHMSVSAQKNT